MITPESGHIIDLIKNREVYRLLGLERYRGQVAFGLRWENDRYVLHVYIGEAESIVVGSHNCRIPDHILVEGARVPIRVEYGFYYLATHR